MTYISDKDRFNRVKSQIAKDIIKNQVVLKGVTKDKSLYKIDGKALFPRNNGELNYRPGKCYNPYSNGSLIGDGGAAYFISFILNKFNCYETAPRKKTCWKVAIPLNPSNNISFFWFYDNEDEDKSIYIKIEIKILEENFGFDRNFYEVNVHSFKPSYGPSVQQRVI